MSALGIAQDWRLAGPDLIRCPYLRASWLPKIRVEAAPANDLDGPCWLWEGARDPYGYGVWGIGPKGKQRFWGSHRYVAHHHYGPLPNDHQPDHLCYRCNCIQPGHLEIITKALNVARANYRRWGTQPALSEIDLAALADSYWLLRNRLYA